MNPSMYALHASDLYNAFRLRKPENNYLMSKIVKGPNHQRILPTPTEQKMALLFRKRGLPAGCSLVKSNCLVWPFRRLLILVLLYPCLVLSLTTPVEVRVSWTVFALWSPGRVRVSHAAASVSKASAMLNLRPNTSTVNLGYEVVLGLQIQLKHFFGPILLFWEVS